MSTGMNKKRAAEVILEGKAFEYCPVCKGDGLVAYCRGSITSIVDPDDPCELCSGTGSRPKGEYLQACVTLNMPFPELEAYDEPF
jgi:DnaJ-class molecular chaperone